MAEAAEDTLEYFSYFSIAHIILLRYVEFYDPWTWPICVSDMIYTCFFHLYNFLHDANIFLFWDPLVGFPDPTI